MLSEWFFFLFLLSQMTLIPFCPPCTASCLVSCRGTLFRGFDLCRCTESFTLFRPRSRRSEEKDKNGIKVRYHKIFIGCVAFLCLSTKARCIRGLRWDTSPSSGSLGPQLIGNLNGDMKVLSPQTSSPRQGKAHLLLTRNCPQLEQEVTSRSVW